MRARTLLALAALAGGACASPPSLLKPDAARLAAVAPDSFLVSFETTRGDFLLKVHRDWSPLGADRLYYLFQAHFYDGARFFRTVDHFVTQFGLSGDPAVDAAWKERRIPDDPVLRSNVRGTLSFAKGGKDSRTTQLYISYKDNSRLDALGFSVVAQVVDGMAVVDSLYHGYGEGPPRGAGPSQERIAKEGNAYLVKEFPKLDHIVTTQVTNEWRHR
ncbi:MAG: peptidylprolyl isomerase [Gemmatimonadetes bacterium]|nr:peptidylprolyl isomerase [Gemmatimonadota bacterium]